jgi:hypothetical protein
VPIVRLPDDDEPALTPGLVLRWVAIALALFVAFVLVDYAWGLHSPDFPHGIHPEGVDP